MILFDLLIKNNGQHKNWLPATILQLFLSYSMKLNKWFILFSYTDLNFFLKTVILLEIIHKYFQQNY